MQTETWEIIVRMLLSILLGGLIGWERERASKPAGIRTHALVSLGSCMFMLIATEGARVWGLTSGVDPTRLAQGLATGVGFLGAGAIIQSGFSVHGLTTAATIWLVCAAGAAVGSGMWEIGLEGMVLALVVLRGLAFLDRVAGRQRGGNGHGQEPPADADSDDDPNFPPR